MKKRERTKSLITNNKVVADVSEDSRDNGRKDVGSLTQESVEERDRLVVRKIKLEEELSEIDHWQRVETQKIISREMPYAKQQKARFRLETQVLERKRLLKKEIKQIQPQLIHLKRKLYKANLQKENNSVILLRIERILANILKEMVRKND